MNKDFQDVVIEIFKNIFSPEQIEEMIQIDLSESDNKLSLPLDEYFKKQFKIANENTNEKSEIIEQNEIELTSYTSMEFPSNPGRITFYQANIALYVSSLIDCLNIKSKLGLNASLYILYFVLSEQLAQQSFHYYADVKRCLTGAKFDIDIENRLAIAHSYISYSGPFKRFLKPNYINIVDNFMDVCNDQNLIRKMRYENMFLFGLLIKEHFKSYQSADYKNWQLYTQKSSYKTHFYDYFKNSKLDELLANGVPVNEIAQEIRLIGIEGAQLVIE
jgi:hypothetical protein